MSDPFIGEIKILPYHFAPRGWLACDGASLMIAEHMALFSVIGTTYGGDGRTTFQLPNLQGGAVMGWGNSPTAGLNTVIGMKMGSSTEVITEASMPKHTHQVLVDDIDATLETPQSNTFAKGGAEASRGVTIPFSAYSSTQVANQPLSEQAISNTGDGQAHENRQPFLVTTYCIATVGVFPRRLSEN